MDIEAAMQRHAATVWRVCSLHLREPADRQDAFQDAFLKYALADDTTFEDDEHRKAWLITVTRNLCRDQLKRAARKNVSLDGLEGFEATPVQSDPAAQPGSATSEVVSAMRALDDPPRTPLYLSIYEGYSAPEIASMLDAPVNTVYSWISRGRAQLRSALS